MLQFQFVTAELLPAILASMPIAHQDVLSRKRLQSRGQTTVLMESDHAWQLQPDMYEPVMRFFDDSDLLQEQHDGAPRPRNIHGLIARIQH
jgi:hypothetical protein